MGKKTNSFSVADITNQIKCSSIGLFSGEYRLKEDSIILINNQTADNEDQTISVVRDEIYGFKDNTGKIKLNKVK